MISLTSTAKKLTKQKQDISKIRRSSEKEFQKAKALSRKYTSSLTSLQKRVVASREKIEDSSQILNQKISQLESIQRLKKAAQERLDLELQNKEKLESDVEFAISDDEKQSIQSRLSIVIGTIDDIKNEIKQRTPTEKKLIEIINEINNSKSKISSSIKKNLESKPKLINLVKSSANKLEQTTKKYQSSKSREEFARTKLNKVSVELSKLLKKRAAAKEAKKAKARAEARAKAKKTKARAEAKAKPKKAKAKPKKAKAKPKNKKIKTKRTRR